MKHTLLCADDSLFLELFIGKITVSNKIPYYSQNKSISELPKTSVFFYGNLKLFFVFSNIYIQGPPARTHMGEKISESHKLPKSCIMLCGNSHHTETNFLSVTHTHQSPFYVLRELEYKDFKSIINFRINTKTGHIIRFSIS